MDKNYKLKILNASVFVLIFAVLATGVYALSVDSSIDGLSPDDSYDYLLDALFANDNVVTTFDNKMWVPWHDSSSSCTVDNLHSGASCNAGEINFENNCMVSDEFSQVGLLVAMGIDPQRMDAFYNTLDAIKSTNGDIPAWRVYRSGNTIEQCKPGVNGNCDTASDATARFIMGLFTASQNTHFSTSARDMYYDKAVTLAYDFLQYETVYECSETPLGNACYWLAAGSEAARGGKNSNDFSYTGYYPDAIIAMLQSCTLTGDQTFCSAADDFTLNYLQASKWDGSSFSVPPGRSFKWDSSGNAQCTGNCNPVDWDGFDASRALGMCGTLYYADAIKHQLPYLDQYCDQWGDSYMQDPSRAVLQYYPNGVASHPPQSGYFAQGLQSLFELGYNRTLFQMSLSNALSHFSTSTNTWDYGACFGVYTPVFSIRALGIGLQRDAPSFPPIGESYIPDTTSLPPQQSDPISPDPAESVVPAVSLLGQLPVTCSGSCVITHDEVMGECRQVIMSVSDESVKLLACNKPEGFVELYRQSSITEPFQVCMGDGCVDSNTGFARFKPNPVVTLPDPSPQEPSPVISPPVEEQVIPTLPQLAIKCSTTMCSVQQDKTSGSCRTADVMVTTGTVKLMACDKVDHVELYRQSNPGGTFEICMGGGCVNQNKGFDSFQMDSIPSLQSSPQQTPASESGVSSLIITAKGSLVSDIIESSGCRLVQYANPEVTSARICQKENNNYEMYLLTLANNNDICVNANCVGSSSGFSSFMN